MRARRYRTITMCVVRGPRVEWKKNCSNSRLLDFRTDVRGLWWISRGKCVETCISGTVCTKKWCRSGEKSKRIFLSNAVGQGFILTILLGTVQKCGTYRSSKFLVNSSALNDKKLRLQKSGFRGDGWDFVFPAEVPAEVGEIVVGVA